MDTFPCVSPCQLSKQSFLFYTDIEVCCISEDTEKIKNKKYIDVFYVFESVVTIIF